MPKIKLQRGQKLCKNCEQPNASRQRECKWCGTAFISMNTNKVDQVIDKGIIAFGISRKNRGMAFIYMGKESFDKKTGIYRSPHRIIRLKTRPSRL